MRGFGQTERGILRNKGEIAGDDNAEAAGMGVAIDGCNERFSKARHGIEKIDVRPAEFEPAGDLRPCSHIVAAEAKYLAISREYAAADRGVAPRLLQRCDQSFSEGWRDALAGIGTAHGQNQHPPFPLAKKLGRIAAARCHVRHHRNPVESQGMAASKASPMSSAAM